MFCPDFRDVLLSQFELCALAHQSTYLLCRPVALHLSYTFGKAVGHVASLTVKVKGALPVKKLRHSKESAAQQMSCGTATLSRSPQAQS